MAYMTTTPPEHVRGGLRLVLWMVKRSYGGIVPGLTQIIISDLKIARPLLALHAYLHEHKRSPLSPLQREMIAVVVNGAIGGAP
jgi:hypothetical protein